MEAAPAKTKCHCHRAAPHRRGLAGRGAWCGQLSVGVRTAPAEGAPVSGWLAVELAAERRVREGTWRLPQFASHGDARFFKQKVAIVQLMDILPYAQLE